jgi:hypothetical protein
MAEASTIATAPRKSAAAGYPSLIQRHRRIIGGLAGDPPPAAEAAEPAS